MEKFEDETKDSVSGADRVTRSKGSGLEAMVSDLTLSVANQARDIGQLSSMMGSILARFLLLHRVVQWVTGMMEAGANQYTFHIEATDTPIELCRQIKESGMKVGIALKPKTSVDTVADLIEQADMILIMTVEPGFGGQSFMEDMMEKVKFLRDNHPDLNIEVDGGVGPKTIGLCAKAGANMIVSGTAVVKAPHPREVMDLMRETVRKEIVAKYKA
eukprot:maker-scaffold369_size193746-snap-gene-0.36 protein:Tk07569 transcript:maker-scaffold369_size193746-snap-gene-0.36-mRNA-1 annotation:"ribulose-phosphate 3-epimerase"